MKIILLGDIHSRWHKVNAIVNHELDSEGVSLSVGDLCTYDFQPTKNQKLVFITGNHENMNAVAQLKEQKPGMHLLSPGEVYKLEDGTTIAGLPGVYSPHFFDEKEKPLKYYSRDDVERVMSIREKIDILLTHEAPLDIGFLKKGKDLGKVEITDLIKHIKPRLALFGHHHVYFEGNLGSTKILGLEQPHHSYLVLDTNSFDFKRHIGLMENERIGYQYEWELEKRKNPNINWNLRDALVYMERGQISDAKRIAEQYLGKEALANYIFATSLMLELPSEFKDDQIDKIISHYQKAIQQDPNFADAHLMLANAYMKKATLNSPCSQSEVMNLLENSLSCLKNAKELNPAFEGTISESEQRLAEMMKLYT